MKLYYYDHCPFCQRVRLAAHLLGLTLEEIPLANDDEATPIGLIGQKVVPILVRDDGSARGESLDIVRELGGERFAGEPRPEVLDWLKTTAPLINRLVMPRDVELGLPEFATASARAYFTAKKTELIGMDFASARARTPEFLAELQPLLEQAEGLLRGNFAAGATPGLDDIVLFPPLRNLSCVKDLVYPPRLGAYVERLASLGRIDLYRDRAC